jgi:hypothetical protein
LTVEEISRLIGSDRELAAFATGGSRCHSASDFSR